MPASLAAAAAPSVSETALRIAVIREDHIAVPLGHRLIQFIFGGCPARIIQKDPQASNGLRVASALRLRKEVRGGFRPDVIYCTRSEDVCAGCTSLQAFRQARAECLISTESQPPRVAPIAPRTPPELCSDLADDDRSARQIGDFDGEP